MIASMPGSADEEIIGRLEQRLGRLYAPPAPRHRGRSRGARVWPGHQLLSSRELVFQPGRDPRRAPGLSGLYGRARRNAANVQVRHHDIVVPALPAAFDGFTILPGSAICTSISNEGAMRRLDKLLPDLEGYDLCVLEAGDYRGKTFGPFDATIEGMARMRAHIAGPAYAVLGNHDTIRMVPALEAMGIRMLLNETLPLVRGAAHLHLAGIDDAHYYRVDNIEKAASPIPDGEFSILLVAHARDLSAGGACRFRPDAERAHPWRADLPAQHHADHPRCDLAAAHGVGGVALSPDGWLHLGRRRLVHRRGPDQLPARKSPCTACAAPSASSQRRSPNGAAILPHSSRQRQRPKLASCPLPLLRYPD